MSDSTVYSMNKGYTSEDQLLHQILIRLFVQLYFRIVFTVTNCKVAIFMKDKNLSLYAVYSFVWSVEVRKKFEN